MSNNIKELTIELIEEMKEYTLDLERICKYANEDPYKFEQIFNEIKELKAKNENEIEKWGKQYFSEIFKFQDSYYMREAEKKLYSIIGTKKEIMNLEQIQNQLNKKSSENENGYKVGDILVSQWGYDQTNINFYQVINTSEKSIKVTEIGALLIEECFNGCEDLLKPNKNSFLGEKVFITRSNHPKIERFYYLSKFDENTNYARTNHFYQR